MKINLTQLFDKAAKINLTQLFDKATAFIFSLLLMILLLGIGIGVIKLLLNLAALFFTAKITGSYVIIISDVLTLIVLLELARSIGSYFEHSRIRMVYIADAAIVFVIREVMIKFFKENLVPVEMYAISVLLLVFTIIRSASIIHYQKEQEFLSGRKT